MTKIKQMELTVLMAGQYEFCPGKKIEIYKKNGLYYVASNGHDFGLVKEITEGTLPQMDKFPKRFHALVIDSIPKDMILKVCVKIGKQ